jgi:hypothetical protein
MKGAGFTLPGLECSQKLASMKGAGFTLPGLECSQKLASMKGAGFTLPGSGVSPEIPFSLSPPQAEREKKRCTC